MDNKATRYWHCRIEHVAETFNQRGSIREVMPRLMAWLSQQRNGPFTLRVGRTEAELDSLLGGSTGSGALPFALEPDSTPAPLPDDTWQSYYERLLKHFDGAHAMALFLANESFDQPQLPWVGDERATRFIHMNASARLYQRADPAEYAALDSYVSQTYPTLYESLTLQG